MATKNQKRIFYFGIVVLLVLFTLNQVIVLGSNNPIFLSLIKTFSPDGVIDCPECVGQNIREAINAVIINISLVWVFLFLEMLKRKQILIFGIIVFLITSMLKYSEAWFLNNQINRLLNRDFCVAILVWVILVLAQYEYKSDVLKRKWIFTVGIILSLIASSLKQYSNMYPGNPIIQLSDKIFLPPDFVILTCIIIILVKCKHKSDVFQIQQFKWHTKSAYIFAFLLIFSWYVKGNREYFREDHFIEQLTVILFFCSSILLGVKFIKPGKFKRLYLLLGVLFFFVLGMEEISWGQRIFDWNTPEVWSEVNYQDETNLHNLFNPIASNVYIFGSLLLGYIFLSMNYVKDYFSRFTWWDNISPFFPSIEYSLWGFIFLFLSIHVTITGELVEIVFSVLGAAYATDIFLQSPRA